MIPQAERAPAITRPGHTRPKCERKRVAGPRAMSVSLMLTVDPTGVRPMTTSGPPAYLPASGIATAS
jgi:hypothetical protein